MANVKYLSYDGLKHYDAKLKDFILKGFANGISVTYNEDEEYNIINLSANYEINNVATSSIIATAAINLATTSKAGLMSKSDKSKLNGIATGAEVNQNAFSKIKVGSTTIEAGEKTDTLTIAAGDNITLTPSAKTLTIAAKDTTYASGDCITIGTDNKINHNPVTATSTNSSSTINHGSKFIAITSVDTDDFGHLTNINIATYTNAPDWTKLDFYATSVHPTTETASEYTVVTEIKDATHTANTTTATAQYTTVKVPSKKYVDDAISIGIAKNDAMHYKGTVTSAAQVTTLSKSCEIGDTYKIATAFGSYEVGDMLIFDKDGSTSTPATYSVIQNNVDGAVYNTTATSIKGNFVAYDSNTGKVIKDSGFNSDSFATAIHGHPLSITGDGDDVITVVPNGGNLSADYKITHKQYASATFTQSATSAQPGTSIKFNVPTFSVDSYGHVENVASSAITVTLPEYPTELKNPYKIKVDWKDENGTAKFVEYDGSDEDKQIDLTKGIYYAATTSTAQYSVTAGHSVTAGNAAVAAKLTTSTGSVTKPVYFKDGKPAACNFTVETSVPAKALFSDTLNTAGTVSTSSAQLYIVGAKSQQESAETYSSPNAYIGQDNKLYAIGSTSTLVASVITCNDAITNAEIDLLF